MKKMIKLLFGIILVFPVVCFGQTFAEGVKTANEYIKKFDKYDRYILLNDNVSYEYTKNGFVSNSEFKSGGFLNKIEFDITSKNSNNISYLAPGIEYWTLTSASGNNKYCIDYQLISRDVNNNSGVRITEYIKPEVETIGDGTYSTPYEFVGVYKITLGTDISKSSIDLSGAHYVASTKSIAYELTAKFGYKYNGYSCSVDKKKYSINENIVGNDALLVFSAMKSDLNCNAKFGPRTFTYNLDTKININGKDVSKIDLVYNDGWFSENKKFTELSKLPTKTGYTFNGLYFKNNGTTIEIIDSNGNLKSGNNTLATENEENYSLISDWTANEYKIVFAGNESASGSMDSINKIYDQEFVLPENKFVRPGYEFSGWSDTPNGSVKYLNKATVKNVTSSGTITLYAVWKSQTFNIAFNNQGATTPGTQNIQATYTFDMPNITVPGKTGYIFGGYYSQINGTGVQYYLNNGKATKKSDLLADTTLYAKWTICNSGTYAVAGATSCTSCPAGKYSAAGAGSCTACPAGRYSAAGASSCTLCPAGKYSVAGAGSCTSCPAGQYSAAGAGSCTACPKGKYSSVAGSSSCTSCPSCKTTAGTGSTSSANCDWNYGTGAQNTVLEGYINHLQVNCNTSSLLSSGSNWYTDVSGKQQSYNYKTEDWGSYGHGYCSSNPLGTYGFKRYWMSIVDIPIGGMPTYSGTSVYTPYQECRYGPIYGKATAYYSYLRAGTNNYSVPTVSGEKTVFLLIRGGGGTTSNTISGLKFIVNGSYYTLGQMVANKFIKPLVIIDGMYATTALGMYNGGSSYGNYAEWTFMFMTNAGYSITGFQLYSAKKFAYNLDDGYYFRSTDINNWRMTYK